MQNLYLVKKDILSVELQTYVHKKKKRKKGLTKLFNVIFNIYFKVYNY